jgi:glycosyltransferase involved in cell wall biosynthesis
MRDCVSNYLGRDAVIMPFLEKIDTYSRSILNTENEGKIYDFIYVAAGEPHKNHQQLVEAWIILASEEIYPVLCLTLNEQNSQELMEWIRNMVMKYDLKILNKGFVLQSTVTELYKQTKALIYPSALESFGLPLIEARNANLAVVASELDYVRDVLDPEETFDPSSPKSIARAVKRFLGYDEDPLPLIEPCLFLKFCMNLKKLGN